MSVCTRFLVYFDMADCVACCAASLNTHLRAEGGWGGKYIGAVVVGSRAHFTVELPNETDIDLVLILKHPLELRHIVMYVQNWQPCAQYIAASVPIIRLNCPVCATAMELSKVCACADATPQSDVLTLATAETLCNRSSSVEFAIWMQKQIGKGLFTDHNLQILRAWAKQRCIYGTINGFPGGAAYAVLFHTVLEHSQETLDCLDTFARVFLCWDFPRPFGSDTYDLMISKNQSAPLIVIQPGFPTVNMTQATSMVQLASMRWECEQILLHRHLPAFPLDQLRLRVVLVRCSADADWFAYVSALLPITLSFQLLFCAHACRAFSVQNSNHGVDWRQLETAFAIYPTEFVDNAPMYGHNDLKSGFRMTACVLSNRFKTKKPQKTSLWFHIKDINTAEPLQHQLQCDSV